ncbi:sulfonate ABC transporter permease [Sporomusaceae bacterium FL31]|nr:sulfonate ABC transporter permease [Sporomusaceae bacterium FL31]GCE32291.1 sulfonate ABC transporter permease [Sporomusaceae bacterium]
MIFQYGSIKKLVIQSAGIIALLCLWEIGPRLGWGDPQFLPPFSVILSECWKMFVDGSLYSHLVISLWRVVLGLLLAAVIALPAGFLLAGRFPAYIKKLNLLFRLLSHINPFSLSPLFLLLFGIGETAKLAIIVFVCVWPILFHTLTGVQNVDPMLIKTARSMKVTDYILAKEVLFPGALPTVITGLRIATQMAVFMLVAAEMLGAKAGLGWLIHNSAMLFAIPRLYAGGLFIILTGFLINKTIVRIEKNSMFWQQSVRLLDAEGDQLKTYAAKQYVPVLAVAMMAIIGLGGLELHNLDAQQAYRENNMNSHQQHHTSSVNQECPLQAGDENKSDSETDKPSHSGHSHDLIPAKSDNSR